MKHNHVTLLYETRVLITIMQEQRGNHRPRTRAHAHIVTYNLLRRQ